jgi:hypothetical protein
MNWKLGYLKAGAEMRKLKLGLLGPVKFLALGGVQCRDVIKDEIGGKLPSERPFRPDVRARPHLPRGQVFTVRGCSCAFARTRARPRGRKKK